MSFNAIRQIVRCGVQTARLCQRVAAPSVQTVRYSSEYYTPPDEYPPPPPYKERLNEDEDVMRSRLLYQSRKRGMLENGLLLSTFAAKYLDGMNEQQLILYDRLINTPSNDWEIYYWAVGQRPVPEKFQSEIMDKLIEHALNKDRQNRSQQPDLPTSS
ncbi:succinate dehydrogenase assembly factor 2, mitochondrial-like [Mizuhopecten yessoensis]|uniref:Succinate dehydrogenase assembly factor 2, mitochondrial n=1 Tax=Mizuhopecten yessoensis TaxID=6573 RepID=A0A210R1R3_MIZYE|nr:succinate dehydrogenase assembly factor 2, mitochondrial-like [Mizuhopecten yessoensis]OWF54939.1 Succinate dehydrogenase assembly factor 2, mitochondrial [Mizuhopecten yessoensis]